MAELNEKRREVNEERVNTQIKLSRNAVDLLKELDPAEIDFFESSLTRPEAEGVGDLPIPQQEALPLLRLARSKANPDPRGGRASTEAGEHWAAGPLTKFHLNCNEFREP